MNDKDQKLIFEAYQQLNESLSEDDIVSAITNAWFSANKNKEVYRKYIDVLKDTAGKDAWRAATGQLFRNLHKMPEDKYDDDMLEVIDAVTPLDIPKLPKSDKPSFQQQFGHLQAKPDDVPEEAMDNERAKALTDDLIEKHGRQYLNQPNMSAARSHIQRVFLSLVEFNFKPVEATLHFENDNTDVWILGNEEFGKFARVTIYNSDNIFRAELNTNTEVGDDDWSIESPDAYELAQAIKHAAVQINDDDEDDRSELEW